MACPPDRDGGKGREEAALAICLFLFWLALNGRCDLEIVVSGAAVSAALTWFARRELGIRPGEERRLLRRLPGAVCFLGHTAARMVRSSLLVMGVILSPGRGRARLVWFPQPVESALARVALANALSLTPGTVTAAMGERTLCVYVLRPRFGAGLKEDVLAGRLRRLEGGGRDG